MLNVVRPFVAAGVCALFALPGGALAAPAITSFTGELDHGRQVTISGSGFGNKSPAKPYLWAPFEGSADPSPLGLVTSWTKLYSMSYAEGEGVGGGGALKASDSSGVWAAAIDAEGFAWNDWNRQMYLFRKVKRNFDITSDLNWKVVRIWPASASGNYPNFFIATNNGAMAVEGVSNTSSWLSDAAKARGVANEWKTDEILYRVNSAADKSDGELAFMVDGVVVGKVPYQSYDGTRTWKMRDNSSSGSALMVRNYAVHGVKANVTFPSDYRYWADDVYLDTTWARVMIGDAPTLESSTHRVIQIPMEWSSNSITVTVNLSAFPSDLPAYLFVVDENGVASPGVLVDLDSSPPTPPKDVKAD